MRQRSTKALLAWSVVGLIAGHQATYMAVYRDPALVGGILEATGHGWLWLAPIFLLSAAVTALVLGFRGVEPVRSFRWRFAFLATIQVAAFTIIELAERSASSLDFGHALAEGDQLVLVVGGAIQVLVALMLALASRVVERAASALARRRAWVPRRRPGRAVRPFPVPAPRPIALGRACTPRAPPVHA